MRGRSKGEPYAGCKASTPPEGGGQADPLGSSQQRQRYFGAHKIPAPLQTRTPYDADEFPLMLIDASPLLLRLSLFCHPRNSGK